jgi:putative nucleotidyltransferase with HDIG domain
MPDIQKRTLKKEAANFNILEEIWNCVRPVEREDRLISSIIQMVHEALGASAASLLLLDEKKQELYFRFADGPVESQLKRLHISRQSGIAGWILRNGKPLIVNDPEKNRNFYERIDKVTGFKTRSIIGVPIIVNEKIIGVLEVLNKRDGTDFKTRDLKVMRCLACTAAVALENAGTKAELLESYKGTIKALVSLADSKESSGGGHSRRVLEYALMAAKELPMSRKDKQIIEYAAILHDIGKLSIPDNVLNKVDAPTDEEWQLIRQHPVIGYNLLKGIPLIQEASKLILYHHERYDGQGYPEGVKGDSIPMGARLLAVADAFDHMTNAHPYRDALSLQQAFTELLRKSGSQFLSKR